MKKNITKQLKGGFLAKIFLFCAVLLWGANPAVAQTTLSTDMENPTEMKSGQSYVPQLFANGYAYFTAETEGTLSVRGTNQGQVDFYSQFVKDEVNDILDPAYELLKDFVRTDDGSIICSIDLTAGQKVYIISNTSLDPIVFSVEFSGGKSSTQVVESTPSFEKPLSIAEVGDQISFVFSKNVTSLSSLTLSYGNEKKNIPAEDFNDYGYRLPNNDEIIVQGIKGDILEIINGGYKQATFTFSGVNGEEDDIKVTFDLAELPLQLISSDNTPNSTTMPMQSIKSYYIDGQTISLTFDKPLVANQNIKAVLGLGQKQEGENASPDSFKEEQLNVEVNPSTNSVIIDLGTKLRNRESLGLTASISDVILTVGPIKGEDGQFAYDPDAAKGAEPGYYTFVYGYDNLNYNVSTEFTPAAGASIDGHETIEIWIGNGIEGIRYNGVKFAYKENGEDKEIIVNNIQTEEDYDDLILTVPVPAMNADAGTVTVSINELQFVDGLEHSGFLASAAYTTTGSTAAELEVTSFTFSEGQEVARIEPDSYITVSTNRNAEIGCVVLSIEDKKPINELEPYVLEPKVMQKTDNGFSFFADSEISIYNNLYLYQGHEYEVKLVFCATEADYYAEKYMATKTLTIKGLTEYAGYSDVTLVSVSPDPETSRITKGEQLDIELTFSGAVTAEAEVNLGSGFSEKLSSVTSNADKTVWTVVVPASYTRGEDVVVVVSAKDEEGRLVKGNNDEYFWFDYFTASSTQVRVEPADGAIVKAPFQTITVSHDSGIGRDWNYSGVGVQVFNESGDQVGTCSQDPEQLENGSLAFTLDEAITAKGKYHIVMPAGYFFVGEQFESSSSAAVSVWFTISDATDDFTPELVSPQPDDKVTELSEITLSFPEAVVWNADATQKPVLNSRFGISYQLTIQKGESDNLVKLSLGDMLISDAGFYQLYIPAGVFGNEAWGNSNYTEGRYNADIDFTIEVADNTAGGNVTITPEEGEVESLSEFLLTFEDATDVSVTRNEDAGNIMLYNLDTYKVYEITPAVVNWKSEAKKNEQGAWWINYAVIALVDDNDEAIEVKESGTYQLNIPAGFFYVDEAVNGELSFQYIIVGSDAVASVFAEAGLVDVYTVNGVCVKKNATANDLKALKKGLYIIGGKKVIIK